VSKEVIISALNGLPEDASLEEIEHEFLSCVLVSTPETRGLCQEIEKQRNKVDKKVRKLMALIKKAELNPRYFEEIIPIKKVREQNIYRQYPFTF